MSGLLFLQTVDFNIQNGTKGKIMCNNVRGISLILFYSIKCEHSRNLIPIFKRLPGQIGGCQFGMVNVSLEKQVVAMSIQTIAPIKYVPLIILFVGGKPFIRYDGPHHEDHIKQFVIEVSNKLQTKEKFSNEKTKQGKNSDIPAYTIGHPLCGQDEVSYLEYDEAYTKKT